MNIKTYKGDLPPRLNLGNEISVDCEAIGLERKRDSLTLCQVSTGKQDCHIIQFDRKNYSRILI